MLFVSNRQTAASTAEWLSFLYWRLYLWDYGIRIKNEHNYQSYKCTECLEIIYFFCPFLIFFHVTLKMFQTLKPIKNLTLIGLDSRMDLVTAKPIIVVNTARTPQWVVHTGAATKDSAAGGPRGMLSDGWCLAARTSSWSPLTSLTWYLPHS